MIKRIRVSGYRSVRDLSLELQPINVLTGPNGCGKSNLYNSLVLLGRAAQGQLAHAVAEEGGTPSLFWAGGERVRYQRKRPPQRVLLSFEGEEYGYELQVGLPAFNEHALKTKFHLDPRVKEEYIWPVETRRKVLMLKRQGPSAWLRNSEGNMVTYPFGFPSMSQYSRRLLIPIFTQRLACCAARSCAGGSITIFGPTLPLPFVNPKLEYKLRC